MRIVIQRVSNAKTEIEGSVYSEIEQGLMILAGIDKADTIEDVKYCANKIANIRLFEDDEGRAWSKSVKELKYDVLLQSQFTLLASLKKGSKPSFHGAMNPTDSKLLYESFVEEMKTHLGEEHVKSMSIGMSLYRMLKPL